MASNSVPNLVPLPHPNHPEVYSIYAQYRARGGFHFDHAIKGWIASSADAVEQVLLSTDCVVRPSHEPVPSHLIGTHAGAIFGHLIRMNEGEKHIAPKKVIKASLSEIRFSELTQHLHEVDVYFQTQSITLTPTHLQSWIQNIAVCGLAKTCGFANEDLLPVATAIQEFVACLSPLSNRAQIDLASEGAKTLLDKFTQLLSQKDADVDVKNRSGLIANLLSEKNLEPWKEHHQLISNIIGLHSQTYEASWGLIGNACLLLQADENLRAQLQTHPELLAAFIDEVSRFDAPVHSTRRFVKNPCRIIHQDLSQGDSIVLLLASANRDEKWQVDAERFILQRTGQRNFSFSEGRHRCPGEQMASHIAQFAVSRILQSLSNSAWSTLQHHYLASFNARIPIFSEPTILQGANS